MKARVGLAAVVLTAWSVVAPAQRLSGTAIPEHYDIHLAPDFVTDTFAGAVTVRVRLVEPTQSVTLHAADIDFWRGHDHGRRNRTGSDGHPGR